MYSTIGIQLDGHKNLNTTGINKWLNVAFFRRFEDFIDHMFQQFVRKYVLLLSDMKHKSDKIQHLCSAE